MKSVRWCPQPWAPMELPERLSGILRANWGDGTHVLAEKNTEYLYGLKDAGVEGAEELINGIEQRGPILIMIDEPSALTHEEETR